MKISLKKALFLLSKPSLSRKKQAQPSKALWILSKLSLFSRKKWAFCLFLMAMSLPVQAVKVYFPDEELATESVLPFTNKPNMILNRNVPLKKALELSLGSGFGLTEPFYQTIYPQVQLGYSISNMHSIHLLGSYYFPKLSTSGERLADVGADGKDGERLYLDARKVAYPQYSLSLNYQYTPFYGKISLSKKLVLNLSIYSFVGGGAIVSNDNDYFPLFRLGIGQKLYFFKSSNMTVGLRGDLGMEMYYGPAVARLDLGQDQTKISYQAAEKKINSNVVANAGIILLISL